MRIAAVGLALVTMLGAGCATLTSGTTEVVRITTDPADATITVAKQTHRAPAEITLSRRDSYIATVQHDGYLTLHRGICRVGNAASTGNLLVGGAVGVLTDQSTGAAFALYPTVLNVQLPATTPGERVFDRRNEP